MNYFVSGADLNGRPCNGVIHEIKKGDTLYKLSRVYDVKIADLIWQNPGVRIYNLQVGDRLCIPVKNAMPDDNRPGNGETFPYVVREEDDLEQILSMFRMTYDELKALNPSYIPRYQAGTVLMIPSDRILRQES